MGQRRKTKEQTGYEMALLLWLGSQLSSFWSNFSTLGVLLTFFTLLFDFMKRRRKWSRYPPGPVSLPFIGTMLSIDYHNPHHSFKQVSADPHDEAPLTQPWVQVGGGCPGAIYLCTKLKDNALSKVQGKAHHCLRTDLVHTDK